jgi:hypothetical protein
MRTIRASELGNFLFCRRAWWYHSRGLLSQNQTELSGGTTFHRRHGRGVFLSAVLRTAGWFFLFAALVVLAVGLTLTVLR